MGALPLLLTIALMTGSFFVVMIFNRWGNEVFATEDYQSDWRGTYRGALVPDGTYYWILLDTENGADIQRGYLTIHR